MTHAYKPGSRRSFRGIINGEDTNGDTLVYFDGGDYSTSMTKNELAASRTLRKKRERVDLGPSVAALLAAWDEMGMLDGQIVGLVEVRKRIEDLRKAHGEGRE